MTFKEKLRAIGPKRAARHLAVPLTEGICKAIRKHRKWGTDAELLETARRFIEKNEIRNRHGLEKADQGLYKVLNNRKLLYKVEFQERRERREWGTDGEVLETARRFIEEKEIRNRKGLERADSGLYKVLYNRKLLDKVEFQERQKQRRWGTDEEVLAIAREYLKKEGIRNRKGLENADDGLYQVLRKRKLLDKLEFEKKREQREPRKWGTDGEVLDFARRLIEEKGIRKRKGLEETDGGLYQVLQKRRLLDKVRFEERQQHRAWGTDEEVLGIARKLIEGKGVKNRKGLERADLGLYLILQKRKLLDQVFASIDHAKHKAAVQGVLDAMDSFGEDR